MAPEAVRLVISADGLVGIVGLEKGPTPAVAPQWSLVLALSPLILFGFFGGFFFPIAEDSLRRKSAARDERWPMRSLYQNTTTTTAVHEDAIIL